MCAYSLLLTASGVGTQSPTWTTAVERKGAVICTPAYARYPFTAGRTGWGGGRQGKKNGQCSSASGGTRTHDPWIMSPMHKPLHHQAPLYIYTYTHTYIHTCIHTYIQCKKKMQIILLPLSGHAHLAEPGCLCTKQALGACASKLLENGLGTRRRTSYLLTASGVGTRSPTWTTAVE